MSVPVVSRRDTGMAGAKGGGRVEKRQEGGRRCSLSQTREKIQGNRMNEWLPICSIPLLERLVPRVQIYPPRRPNVSSLSPCFLSTPLRAHASHLSTMGTRFHPRAPPSHQACLNTDVRCNMCVWACPGLSVCLRFCVRVCASVSPSSWLNPPWVTLRYIPLFPPFIRLASDFT